MLIANGKVPFAGVVEVGSFSQLFLTLSLLLLLMFRCAYDVILNNLLLGVLALLCFLDFNDMLTDGSLEP